MSAPPPADPRQRHLDLGCGEVPRNPYGREELYGLDIRAGLTAPGVVRIEAANLTVQPIPYQDDFFDSLSAFDFLEHVPRVVVRPDGTTSFPFIQLMNEIWRVLKPGGRFYASTPAYPHEKAFRDPTHVNVIAAKTWRYFCDPYLEGTMYGFHGRFRKLRQVRTWPHGRYEPRGVGAALGRGYHALLGKASHLVWELEAVKPAR